MTRLISTLIVILVVIGVVFLLSHGLGLFLLGMFIGVCGLVWLIVANMDTIISAFFNSLGG